MTRDASQQAGWMRGAARDVWRRILGLLVRQARDRAQRLDGLDLGSETSGVIREGADADLILIDMDKPHLLPRHDLAANAVHSARGGDIDHVIVDGRILMRKGELITLDEEKIKREAEARAFRLVNSEHTQTRTYRS